MIRTAKIIDGVVDTVSLARSPDHEWVKVSADVFAGFTDNGDGTFSPPLMPPTYADYDEAAAAVVAHINSAIDTVRSQYPVAVQMNWADEEAMAAAYLSETEDAQQLATLTADAAAKGRTPAEHAARILANAQAFRAMAAQARTLWLATDAQLSSVSDPHELEAIVDAAKAEATALLSA